MIRFDRVSLTYPDAAHPVLRDVSLQIPEGELALVVGRTGAGKSSLLRTINGLAPSFTGGTLSGRDTVAGRDTSEFAPRELADVVGAVLQDPRDGFVTEVVEDEIAYGMESLGLPPDVMRRRVEEALDMMGLHELRARPLRSLSGGQQQRTAIASVLAQHPSVLVLDEPTSALDPAAAEDVLAALQRLVHDLGMTVLLAEHRLERVVQYADRVVQVEPDGTVSNGTPRQMMATAPVAPPVVQLGRWAKWEPLPLSIRDARRVAEPLRQALRSVVDRRDATTANTRDVVAELKKVDVQYGTRTVLKELDFTMRQGEIVALMGRNGAGKSTLLRTLVGFVTPARGSALIGTQVPSELDASRLARTAGMVPQEPGDLLWSETARGECDDTSNPRLAVQILRDLVPDVQLDTHPRDLSEGQRLALALAVVLAAEAPLLLLDEPTRGLDYPAKQRLITLLRRRAASGIAVLIATHDVELAAELATRTVVLADGDIVSDGPTNLVVTASPQFAPQIAKVLAPEPYLTVADVLAVVPEPI
jgi:energy-coupling factor transport system ATP-binding protein